MLMMGQDGGHPLVRAVAQAPSQQSELTFGVHLLPEL